MNVLPWLAEHGAHAAACASGIYLIFSVGVFAWRETKSVLFPDDTNPPRSS